MSRSIAAAGQYKFGECGFIVDGMVLIDGTKRKNMRIYRQRSHRLYDILDPVNDVIYRKVQITAHDKYGYLLDYRKTDDQLIQEIPNNSFFVRGHTDEQLITDPTGFVLKFLYRKVFLGDSTALFNMYIPECGITDHDIDNILVFPVQIGDDMVSGRLFNAWEEIDTNGMVITVTMPDGTKYYTTEIIDDVFSVDVPVITETGTGTVTVNSPNYNEKSVDFVILNSDEDIGFTTSILVSKFEYSTESNSYNAIIPANIHNRGSDLILQTYEDGQLVTVDMIVDADGNITLEQTDSEILNLSIIGKTIDTIPYTKNFIESDWYFTLDLMYDIDISSTEHGKQYPQVQIYDSENHIVMCDIQIDEDDNIKIKAVDGFDCKIVIVGYDK